MHTFDHSALFQLRFWNPANTIRSEVCVPRLDAAQAAQVLVARFLPLGYQISVRNLLPDAVVVQLPADGFSSIKQIVDVSGLLVVDLEDGPQALVDPLALVSFCLGWKHEKSR